VCERPMRALGRVGEKEYARIPTAFTSRSYLTTLPCISAAGDHLAFTAVVKGRTALALRKIRSSPSKAVQRVSLL